MDSFTQIVLGVAVCNATLGKKIGNRSLLYGAVLGTLPDLDVWVGHLFYDPISAVEIHRGFSHSFVFFITSSFLWAFLIQKIEIKNKVTYREAYWSSFLILVTHALLDVFTTWGTQMLWPLEPRWAIKSIFVVDPLYTLPFLIFLICSLRLPQKSKKRSTYTTLGLMVSSCYLLLTMGLQQLVRSKVAQSLKEQNLTYDGFTVKPTALNTILWNVIVKQNDAYLLSEYSFFDSQPIAFEKHLKNTNLIAPIKNEPVVQQLLHISEKQYIMTQFQDTLYFNDLRFGILKNEAHQTQYAFSYQLYPEKGKWAAKETPKKRADGLELLQKLYFRMKGN